MPIRTFISALYSKSSKQNAKKKPTDKKLADVRSSLPLERSCVLVHA